MVGVQMESVGGHQYPPRSLSPQNGSRCTGLENLQKILSCAEVEKLKELMLRVQMEYMGHHRYPPQSFLPVGGGRGNSAELGIGFVHDVADLLTNVLDVHVPLVGSR